ncbi:MAG TPA: hypothetical protein VNV65_11915 [Candidatus Solibacter sp.]|nr:hypothetical protein [Candidatus Solibacter sp.]
MDLILIASGVGLLASFVPQSPVTYDAYIRYHALVNLLSAGQSPNMKYSFVGPLFATPLYWLGRILGAPASQWVVMHYNLLLFCVLLLGLWALLRNRVDRGLVRTFLLIMVAASMFGFATQDFLGEMFTAVLVGLGAIAVVTGPRLAGWAGLAVGTANTPAAVLGVGLVVLKRVVERRRLRYVLALAATAGLTYLDARYRQQHLLTGKYLTVDSGFKTILPYSGRPGFSYPFPFGLLSILFSFGKGLVFFAPGLLIPARRFLRQRAPAVASGYELWIWYLAGMVLTYSAWWAWYGGFTWGPRFFLVACLPASLALAAFLRFPPRHVWALVGVAGVLVLSCWVGANGVVWGNYGQDACMASGFTNEHLCWYVPEFSVLWRPFVVPKTSFTGLELTYLGYSAITVVWLGRSLVQPLWAAARAEFWRVVNSPPAAD